MHYGFAACGAVLGSVPLAAGCAPEEAVGFPGTPAGASGRPIVTAELTPGLALVPLDACVAYCGVRLFHHAARPENQPSATGGCPFPSYAGEDMG